MRWTTPLIHRTRPVSGLIAAPLSPHHPVFKAPHLYLFHHQCRLIVPLGQKLWGILGHYRQRWFSVILALLCFLTQTVRLQQNFSATESIAIRSNLTNDSFSVTHGVFGNLTVDMNPDPKATETLVKLQASTSHHTLLEQTNICIYSNDSDNGLTIYVCTPLSCFTDLKLK